MPVLKAVWPVLDFCFKNCASDSGIVKANCQILRHALLSMKAYFLPLVPAFVALLTDSFERHHSPQLLSLLAVTANLFNRCTRLPPRTMPRTHVSLSFTDPRFVHSASHAQALELLGSAITTTSTIFFTAMQQGSLARC
jgi:hypothetical protein